MELALMWSWLLALIIGRFICQIDGAVCDRRPLGADGERSPVDQNFQILIDGNPQTFIPGQHYNVSLSCPVNMKFISFTLVAESENNIEGEDTGHFEIFDGADTKFSTSCANMIESTNTNGKNRADVMWVAPTMTSACILFKAGVLQHRNVWFIDDGFLTKRICPEEIDEINSLSPPLERCCACDEAKYEIILERKWARNTHAKDFPTEAWRTRFSEIIGASHTYDYRFWEYGTLASRGLQEMAEHGATATLEAEIKESTYNGNIRTIIKAPGIAHKLNVMGTTLATARLDPKHHMISLVTKIDPSPDWILGIAGLELCLSNCTWIERKVLNLYPWDTGTDAGPSYMSPDQIQKPPDVIRRITSSFPSDHRSPFYEESGQAMRPLATLYLTRKKLYIRECEAVEDAPLECATHPWNSWSECSTRCGPGTQYRVRFYKSPALAESYNCDLLLREERECMGQECGEAEGNYEREIDAECDITRWSTWSPCSNRCGKGFMTRTRDYKNPYAREKCQIPENENFIAYFQAGVPLKLEQTKECFGQDCGGTIQGDVNDFGQDNDQGGNMLFGENEPDTNQAYNPNWNQYPSNNVRTNNQNRNRDDPNQSLYGNRRPDSTYGNTRYSQPRVNDGAPTTDFEDDTVPQSNIYGNEQLIGANPSFGEIDNQYNNQPETSFRNTNNQRNSNINRYQPTQRQNQPQQQRTSYNSPGYNDRNRDRNRDDSEIHVDYDEEGLKIVTVAGSDPNNYNVVQEYCYRKPYPSKRKCFSYPIVWKNYWFYDSDDGECKIFVADNCDENQNKFLSMEACEGTCHRPQVNQQVTENNDDINGWSDGFGEPQSQVRGQGRQRERGYTNRRNYNRFRY